MPRDLLADRNTLDAMPQLSREPPASSPPPKESSPMPSHNSAVFVEERFKKMKEIRPFGQLLNFEDLDDCDWLEHAAFDPVEAASREKVSHRRHLQPPTMFFSQLCSPSISSLHRACGITIGLLSGIGPCATLQVPCYWGPLCRSSQCRATLRRQRFHHLTSASRRT
jgi:hypothetical protein